MTLERAIEVLTEYNKWRRHEGEPTPPPFSGTEIGAAIDVATHAMWRLNKIQKIVYFGEGDKI